MQYASWHWACVIQQQNWESDAVPWESRVMFWRDSHQDIKISGVWPGHLKSRTDKNPWKHIAMHQSSGTLFIPNMTWRFIQIHTNTASWVLTKFPRISVCLWSGSDESLHKQNPEGMYWILSNRNPIPVTQFMPFPGFGDIQDSFLKKMICRKALHLGPKAAFVFL